MKFEDGLASRIVHRLRVQEHVKIYQRFCCSATLIWWKIERGSIPVSRPNSTCVIPFSRLFAIKDTTAIRAGDMVLPDACDLVLDCKRPFQTICVSMKRLTSSPNKTLFRVTASVVSLNRSPCVSCTWARVMLCSSFLGGPGTVLCCGFSNPG